MLKIGVSVIVVSMLTCHLSYAQSDTLSFGKAVQNSIRDQAGHGTGFTDRLPGTGAEIPDWDPNLDIISIPGTLMLTSTRAGLNVRANNLGKLEAPGVSLNGIRRKDIAVSALFTNVTVPNGSDHLMLYVGTAIDHCIKAGVHETESYLLVENNGGSDEIKFDSGRGAFASGDDILLTLSRNGRSWHLSWQNLTNPAASGVSRPITVDSLDSQSKLYVGIIHSNAGNPTPQTAQVHFFTSSIKAESSDHSQSGEPADSSSTKSVPSYLKHIRRR